MTHSQTTSDPASLLLAVDAGGTKTAVWLVDSTATNGKQVLGRGRSTAGNPLSVGFVEATRVISEAIEQAYEEARRPVQPVPRAVLSIAGAANHHLGERFRDWARQAGMAQHVAVVSDVLPVLAAGTPNCCGVALVSGTGSVAFGRTADGSTALCGGWGYLLGDEGSGYAVGRAALQHVLQNLESKAARSPLTDTVLRSVGANAILELTRAIYESPEPRTAIAAIAPLIIKAAEAGDADAQEVLDTAARDLAQLVRRTVAALTDTGRVIQWGTRDDDRLPLAVSGGVLVTSGRMQERFQAELRRLGLDCNINVIDDPLTGCVRLAAPQFADTLVTWH